MAAPRITNYPTPGFHQWVFNMPVRQPMLFQWKGVYYASGMSAANRRVALLGLKRENEAAEKSFRDARDTLALSHHAQAAKFALATRVEGDAAAAAAAALNGLVGHCISLNAYGMNDAASPLVTDLAQAGKLDGLAFAKILESLAAPEVVAMLRRAETDNDPAEAMKRAADWSGASRAREASRVLDLCHATSSSGKATISHFNGLMSAFLTCGFADAARVHRQVYDSLGTHKVNPTARTYELVMQSLCLTGNTAEAESIFDYLRHRHPQSLTSGMYETMIVGWTHERDYSKADATWKELVHRGGQPAPTATTFEMYLRSIFALANTPINSEHIQLGSSDGNIVELKRIPALLKEAKALGIPLTHLSPIAMYKINDALRKFALPKSRFYNWGRSVNQFGVLDWRRRHNQATNMQEINPAVLAGNRVRQGSSITGYEVVPAALSAPPTWEQTPLRSVLNDETIEESTARGRERFTPGIDSIHERPPTWMSQVPDTRYDKLYGLSKPNLGKLGVRRALLSTGHPNSDNLQDRDRRIVSSTLSRARRVRTSVDRLRTHREE